MTVDDEFELTPTQKLREQEVIQEFFRLMRDERSRYENQAINLIKNRIFEKETDNFELSYRVKEDTYLCQIRNKNRAANSYEIEFPIPEFEKDKIETLIELFAQSEAERKG
jgi:hypothetical protein